MYCVGLNIHIFPPFLICVFTKHAMLPHDMMMIMASHDITEQPSTQAVLTIRFS